ncbi:hypothetical protein GUJ93_ZPchr0007g5723 [Zizania palustris]|uniref:Uncharacterized protein n=1 Tax=Zizania palustris TaxID=103762 RepID=A0A8J5SQJ6_ZIZPA|nr:hypothetical protein GUJ93_ZPchr0007g5723 [Zizania palustris]
MAFFRRHCNRRRRPDPRCACLLPPDLVVCATPAASSGLGGSAGARMLDALDRGTEHGGRIWPRARRRSPDLAATPSRHAAQAPPRAAVNRPAPLLTA